MDINHLQVLEMNGSWRRTQSIRCAGAKTTCSHDCHGGEVLLHGVLRTALDSLSNDLGLHRRASLGIVDHCMIRKVFPLHETTQKATLSIMEKARKEKNGKVSPIIVVIEISEERQALHIIELDI